MKGRSICNRSSISDVNASVMRANLRSHLCRLKGSRKHEVEEILYKIHRFYNHAGLSHFNRMRHAFHELLLFIYDCCQELFHDRITTLTEKEIHVANAIHFIEQHFMEEVNLDKVAANIYVSKLMGQSPEQYLKRISGFLVPDT